jgi:dihydrodipicolinate synthase/N-acetylneuraminate lyase
MTVGRGPLRGVVAAALTPLRERGREPDFDRVGRLADFYINAGMTGIFVGGTTGESLLLTPTERKRLLAEFLAAVDGRLMVAFHAGAQSTAATVDLAQAAAELGSACVAVAPPPFFALDDAALGEHLRAAAFACLPLPFYVYEIRQRTGYSIPVPVIEELREKASNFVGMKVSDPTWEEVERYLLPDLDLMVGAEALAAKGLAHGAVGAVSGLAGALPRHVAAALDVPGAGPDIESLRKGLERFPFHAAAKLTAIAQGVAIGPWVRPPLRQLHQGERSALDAWLADEVLHDVDAAQVG